MKKSYRNMAFLTELLINVLVFSISCAILVGLFGKAGEIAKQTREESFAGVEIYALFEMMRADGIENIPGAQEQQDGSYLLGYNEEWRPVSAAVAKYVIKIETENNETIAGNLQKISAVAKKASGKEICRFNTAIYLPQEGGLV